MAPIVLLGAGGYTGRLVAAELVARGHRFVAAGRDPARLRRALDGIDGVDGIREADATDPVGLDRCLQGARLLLTTVGPYEQLGRPVLEAALRRGCDYVDVSGEQPFLRWAYGRDEAARAAGVTAVPGAGVEFLVGDLLAALAAGAVRTPREMHVTYTLKARGLAGSVLTGRSPLSAGTRRSAAGLLGRGAALVDGELVDEVLGEARRLAWFPRPLGPTHAAGVPGADALAVPRHVPAVRTVRTYLAVPGWQAELMQLAGNAARWAWARRLASTVLERGGQGPSPGRRAATRWACVAEAGGDDEVARAWASGTDLYRTAAVAAVATAESLLGGRATAGVLPPALAELPDRLLDRIAARSDLLWSVAHPDRGVGPAG